MTPTMPLPTALAAAAPRCKLAALPRIALAVRERIVRLATDGGCFLDRHAFFDRLEDDEGEKLRAHAQAAAQVLFGHRPAERIPAVIVTHQAGHLAQEALPPGTGNEVGAGSRRKAAGLCAEQQRLACGD